MSSFSLFGTVTVQIVCPRCEYTSVYVIPADELEDNEFVCKNESVCGVGNYSLYFGRLTHLEHCKSLNDVPLKGTG